MHHSMSEMHHNVGERELVSKREIIGWRKIQRKRRELNPGKNFQGDFGQLERDFFQRLLREKSEREKIFREKKEDF